MTGYGKSLHLDLIRCDIEQLRESKIQEWFGLLCKLIGMKHVRQQHIERYLNGTSAVQFMYISMGSIMIHASTSLREAHIDIFTCKDFEEHAAETFCVVFFSGEVAANEVLNRPGNSEGQV